MIEILPSQNEYLGFVIGKFDLRDLETLSNPPIDHGAQSRRTEGHKSLDGISTTLRAQSWAAGVIGE